MAKIKAGKVNTATADAISVFLENQTESGNFEVVMGGSRLGIDQARQLAAVLTSAADKAEILDAAVAA